MICHFGKMSFVLRNFGLYDSRMATLLAGGAGPVQFKEGMMRQKWGLIRAVSVAVLFSTICVLNNGTRSVHTLLEIRATDPAPIAAQADEGQADDGLTPLQPDAAINPKTDQDDQAELHARERLEP